MKHNMNELVDVVYELATKGRSGLTMNPNREERHGLAAVMWTVLVAPHGRAPTQVVIRNAKGEFLYIDHQYPQDEYTNWITHPNCVGGTMADVEEPFKNAIVGSGVFIVEYGDGCEDTFIHVRGDWWHRHSSKNNRHHVPKGAVFEAYEGIREDAIMEFYGTNKLNANHHRAFESALRMAKDRFNNR